jgi:hypothetical protein
MKRLKKYGKKFENNEPMPFERNPPFSLNLCLSRKIKVFFTYGNSRPE